MVSPAGLDREWTRKIRQYQECQDDSAERCERNKPLMATRTRKSPTAKMGAQGSQFHAGRSMMATVGLVGSYRTITGTFVLPAIEDPSQSWNWTKRSSARNSTMGI